MFFLIGCGASQTGTASQYAYRDLERLVTLGETSGWDIDQNEVDELVPEMLMTLCQIPRADREVLRLRLESSLEEKGGDPAIQFGMGKSLHNLSSALTLWRMNRLLDRSLSRISQCPFWFNPEGSFRGRQRLDDQWFVSLGGGGKGIVAVRGGESDLNGGGAGRLLLGYGFGTHWTWMAGLEAGASASFAKTEDGERNNLRFGVDLVFPVVARYRLVNSYVEAEVGALVHVIEDADAEPGVHVGLSVGGNTARRRWVLPGAAFGISYERTLVEVPTHFIKVGFRVALDVPL